MATEFVFHDPSGRRWARVRRATQIGAFVLLALAALVAIAVVSNPQLPVIAMVTNFRNGWQSRDLHTSITQNRDALIENIYSNVTEHKFAGVSIDFEQLPARDRAALVQFMTALRAKFAPAGLLVTEAVPA